MLSICTDISKFEEFKHRFKSSNAELKYVDIATVSSESLVEQAESILQHHTDVCVFLGYLEPGWMLELPHQTILRKLIRTHEVGVVCQFTDSLPFSWKNEIRILYS